MKSKDEHIIPDSREHVTFNHEEKGAETSLSDPDLCKSVMGNSLKSSQRQTHRPVVHTYVNYLNKNTGDEDV